MCNFTYYKVSHPLFKSLGDSHNEAEVTFHMQTFRGNNAFGMYATRASRQSGLQWLIFEHTVLFNRQREVLAKKLECCTSTLSTVYLGEVFKLQLSECIKMFESYLEDLQTALGNCSEGVASGQHYCNLVTSGWIKFMHSVHSVPSDEVFRSN